jgi:small-conductance mechanosensitive channel
LPDKMILGLGIVQNIHDLKSYFTAEIWMGWLFTLVQVILILIAGRIIIIVVNKAISKTMVERPNSRFALDQRRTVTFRKLMQNVVSYTINFIVILMVLNQFGVHLAPLLAGAGVVGLAVGFGAQSLVKDIITGFFIILEDQFAVGDVIQTKTFKGTVEAIGLRTTRIKSWTGEVHIIPNGTFQEVTNFSVNNSLAVVDVTVSNERNLDKIQSALVDIMQKLHETDDNIIKAPQVLGVQTLGEAETVIRITAECRPTTQGAVARRINGEIRSALYTPDVKVSSPQGDI